MSGLATAGLSVDASWVGGLLVFAFGAALMVAVIVRVGAAIVRKKPRAVRDGVFRPILGAGAAQSEAYGWKPAADSDARPIDPEHRD